MAHQDNPFALLLDDDEGDDVSLLLAKVEPKIQVLPPASSDQIKQHKNGSNESVRGRGRGGRGRGMGRNDGVDQPEHSYGRGGIGRGRGRSFGGFGGRNQVEFGNGGDGEVGGELRERSYFGDGRQAKFDARRFGEENKGVNGEERENIGFRGYDQNRRLRGHGSELEKREFRDGEGYEKSYGGDGEGRGFRGGEGRGRGYGGRGWRGGRDGGRGGGRYESNDGGNEGESKKVSGDEKELIINSTNNGDVVSGRDDRGATEEPKDEQSEKPAPENITSEDNTSKVPAEDNEMTLAEYEKLLQEKRKALESLKTEARKVVIDKDFEGMQIIEKKKEDDLTKVVKSDNDKGKKKEIIERDEKSRKPQSINEFLKPVDGERYRGPAASSRGRGGGRGRGRGGYISSDYPNHQPATAAAPSLEDPTHFPILGAAAKA